MSFGHSRVAVIVVNWNARADLDHCLQAVAAQTRSADRVVVVDNASSDGSADDLEARHPGVEVIRSHANLGFAAANNLGAGRVGDCEWLALVNPDAFLAPDWLERMLTVAEAAPDVAALGCRLVLDDLPDRLDGVGDAYHLGGFAWRMQHGQPASGVGTTPFEIFGPSAAAAIYRRDAFVAVGGFEERFFCYLEDADLAFRLRLAGHRCLTVPEAIARHRGSATAGRASDFTVYHAHRNLVWAWIANMPTGLLWRALPHHLLFNLLTVLWFSLRGQAGPILRAKRDAIRGLAWALRRRRHVQATRVASIEAVQGHLASGIRAYVVAAGRAKDQVG